MKNRNLFPNFIILACILCAGLCQERNMVAFGSLWLRVDFESRVCVCVCLLKGVGGGILINASVSINVIQKGGDNVAHISSSSSHLSLSCSPSLLVASSPPSLSFDSLSFPATVYTRRLRTYLNRQSLYQPRRTAAFSPGCLFGPMCLASWFFHIPLAYVSVCLVIFPASRTDVKHSAG